MKRNQALNSTTMRASNAYLVNGILLLLAIGSWSLFLVKKSPIQEHPSAEIFAASLLYRYLPDKISEITLEVETADGKTVDAFPSLVGKRVTSTEMRQIDMQIKFHVLLGPSRMADDHRDWKRLGTTRISSPKGPVVEMQVFRTPDDQLGFQHEKGYYKTDGEVKPIIEFIHDVRNTPKR